GIPAGVRRRAARGGSRRPGARPGRPRAALGAWGLRGGRRARGGRAVGGAPGSGAGGTRGGKLPEPPGSGNAVARPPASWDIFRTVRRALLAAQPRRFYLPVLRHDSCSLNDPTPRPLLRYRTPTV